MADDELAVARSIRRAISDACGGDPDRVFSYYEEAQRRIKEAGQYELVDQRLRIPASSGENAK